MRLPGLPVSRRRHEAAVLNRRKEAEARGKLADTMEAERDKARSERDAALSRVVELEQAIREHRQRRNASDIRNPYPQDDAKLWSVLDGHDRQERGDESVTYPDGSGYLMSWEADGDH